MGARRAPSNAASIYRTNQLLLIVPVDLTTEGLRLEQGTAMTLPRDASPPQVGAALHEALRIGRRGVPHPDFRGWSIAESMRHLLEATGLASNRQFVQQSNHCSAAIVDDHGELVPSRNGGDTGPDKGYHYLPELTVTASVDDSALGQAVFEALNLCTGLGPKR